MTKMQDFKFIFNKNINYTIKSIKKSIYKTFKRVICLLKKLSCAFNAQNGRKCAKIVRYTVAYLN